MSDSGCWQQLEVVQFVFPQAFRAAQTLDMAKSPESGIRMVRFRCSTSDVMTWAASGLPLRVVILPPMHFAGH
jgi:hypothetical protein